MVDEPEAPQAQAGDPEDEEGGPIKTFLEHLEDLRWVLIKSVSALLIGMVGSLSALPKIIEFLSWPLTSSGANIKLQFFGPIGGFTSSMKISLYAGIIVALPFILYFVGQFILPALKKNEKRFFLWAFIIGGGLFLTGVMFCYFWVLQITLKAASEFNSWLGLPTDQWRAEEYFQFVTLFMLGMGLAFELPVVVLSLVKLGLISYRTLAKSRPYFFIINFAVVSFITPDFVSTFFIVIPLAVLMEICIWIAWWWDRQERKRAAQSPSA